MGIQIHSPRRSRIRLHLHSRSDDRPPSSRRTGGQSHGTWAHVHVSFPRFPQYRHGHWHYASRRCAFALSQLWGHGSLGGHVFDRISPIDKTSESTGTQGRVDGLAQPFISLIVEYCILDRVKNNWRRPKRPLTLPAWGVLSE